MASGDRVMGASAFFVVSALLFAASAALTAIGQLQVWHIYASGFILTITGVLDTDAVCRIFDTQGRLVKVLFDSRLTGGTSRNLTWDARDENFEYVPAGLYICHLQTTDNTGNTTTDRAPIVVAVRLK